MPQLRGSGYREICLKNSGFTGNVKRFGCKWGCGICVREGEVISMGWRD